MKVALAKQCKYCNVFLPLLRHELKAVSLSVYFRDGGLKRKQVKESFKEEQQKKYCQLVT